MEEKIDLYDILVLVLLVLNIFNVLTLVSLKREIDNYNERQTQVNEYVMNRIGG